MHPRPLLAAGDGEKNPQEPARQISLPLKVEQRYVWLKDGEKIGETTFRLERVPNGNRFAYLLSASRRYDHEGVSQKSDSTTVIEPDGMPLKFKETLDMSTLNGVRTRQETELLVKGKKAHVTSIHNGNEKQPVARDIELPERTFLFANQAVEHWAILTSAFPPDLPVHEMNLLYPDFDKVFSVTFRSKGKEELTLGQNKIEAVRYTFHSKENELNGSLWLDKKGRMVQIEYPAASLRVVLAPGS